MDANTAKPPIAEPPRRPLSAEITPAEFDYYMKKAQQMRADSFADILDRLFAFAGRLFGRARPRARRHEPVLTLQPRSLRPGTAGS
jgi:hypothetical protein